MKNKLIVVLTVAVFGIVGVPGVVFAVAECPDRHNTNLETNAEFLAKGQKIAREALEHARQGDGAEAKTSGLAALDALKCIVSTHGGAQLQGPVGKIRNGSYKAGQGKMDIALPMLEEGVAKLNKVDLAKSISR